MHYYVVYQVTVSGWLYPSPSSVPGTVQLPYVRCYLIPTTVPFWKGGDQDLELAPVCRLFRCGGWGTRV